MKSISYLLLLFALLVVTACRDKNRANQKSDHEVLQSSTDEKGLQRMQTFKSENSITFKGKEYRSIISRTPDETLPLVSNDRGDKFVDNKVVLRLINNGTDVVNTTLTKGSFAGHVSVDFLSKSILEGVVYHKTTPQGIVFAASICYPQTDLYIPLSITISSDGKMQITKVEMLEEELGVDSM